MSRQQAVCHRRTDDDEWVLFVPGPEFDIGAEDLIGELCVNLQERGCGPGNHEISSALIAGLLEPRLPTGSVVWNHVLHHERVEAADARQLDEPSPGSLDEGFEPVGHDQVAVVGVGQVKAPVTQVEAWIDRSPVRYQSTRDANG